MFSTFYEKDVCQGYSCLDVLKNLQNPLDLVTRDFSVFLKSQIWILASLAGLFGLFVVLLAKGISAKFTSVGGSMITAGLPYFMIKVLEKNIGTMLPAEAAMAIPFLTNLLAPILNIFLIILIIGAVLSAVGLGIKIYQKIKEKKGSVNK